MELCWELPGVIQRTLLARNYMSAQSKQKSEGAVNQGPFIHESHCFPSVLKLKTSLFFQKTLFSDRYRFFFLCHPRPHPLGSGTPVTF